MKWDDKAKWWFENELTSMDLDELSKIRREEAFRTALLNQLLRIENAISDMTNSLPIPRNENR